MCNNLLPSTFLIDSTPAGTSILRSFLLYDFPTFSNLFTCLQLGFDLAHRLARISPSRPGHLFFRLGLIFTAFLELAGLPLIAHMELVERFRWHYRIVSEPVSPRMPCLMPIHCVFSLPNLW